MSISIDDMYSKLPNLVLGFHGCKKEIYESVLQNHEKLKKSENDYDWLGHGVYFWENSYERAKEWAVNRYGEDGRVLGAIIDLGSCLNLTDYSSTEVLKTAFDYLERTFKSVGKELPQNKKGKSKTDILLRNLDCAVIQCIHQMRLDAGFEDYDSVRGVFTEGEKIYSGSGFVSKTHIQLCIVNPNCIKGYFAPMERATDYNVP